MTDQIEKGNVEIEYCPTDKMVGDYLSKPLQGSKFRKFRTSILNLKAEDPKSQSRKDSVLKPKPQSSPARNSVLKSNLVKLNLEKSNRVKDSKTRLKKK